MRYDRRLINRRCDLGIALLNGSDHIFYSSPCESVIRYPEKLSCPSDGKMQLPDSIDVLQTLDNDLETAWRVMGRFCMLINLAIQTQRLIRPEVIYETMISVMYRLLDMKFSPRSIDEAIRQGLLAFCYHVFLQWQDIKPPYQYFPSTYKDGILSLEFGGGSSPQLMLWLSMIGAVSVFNLDDEPWLLRLLRTCAGKCEIRTWDELQGILKSFMWIPLLNEQPGKHVYDLLQLEQENQ